MSTPPALPIPPAGTSQSDVDNALGLFGSITETPWIDRFRSISDTLKAAPVDCPRPLLAALAARLLAAPVLNCSSNLRHAIDDIVYIATGLCECDHTQYWPMLLLSIECTYVIALCDIADNNAPVITA